MLIDMEKSKNLWPDACPGGWMDPEDEEELAAAGIMIGSRFHSLVSTLSMGVPAIALGWAHKYDLLMEDFGIPDHMHYPDQDADDLLDLLDHTLHNRNNIAGTVKERGSELADEVETMWQEVTHLLKSRLSCRNERNL